MIFIVVKFPVKPERADEWISLTEEFTRATRAEPGNLWFEWSRSVDDPTTFVVVEAFADGAAGAAHVATDHFKKAIETMSELVRETPQIVNVEIPDRNEWSQMGEVSPR
jgi:quinol monooxygenase YgiN